MYEPGHTHTEYREAPERNSWTGYTLVKYGFTVLIVIAILYLLAPAITS